MWSDIAAIYRASKKKQDINWWTEWVCRPPAAAFVYFAQRTPLTPNQVTFLSAALMVVACGLLFLISGHLGVVLAVLMFEVSFILDCADGQLARIKKVTSPLGHHLDFLMDELKAMLLLSCVSVWLWLGSDDVTYLLVGIGGLLALASGLSLTGFMRRPEYSGKTPTKDGQPAEIPERTGPVGKVLTLIEHAARVVVHYPSYIWLLGILDRLDIYFWAYVAVNSLYVCKAMLQILLRMGRPHDKKSA